VGLTQLSYPVGAWGDFRGLKRTKREAYHSTPSIAEVGIVKLYLYYPIHLHDVELD
jgi:hypothetical protein